MDKNSFWKWLILVALIAGSLAIVLPFQEKVTLGLDLQGGTRYVLEVDTTGLSADVVRDAPERALEVIRNRVDKLGVKEPVIYTERGNRIVVEIPGLSVEDRERALELIRSTAFLEFRIVHANNEELVEELFAKSTAPEGYKIVSATSGEPGARARSYFKRDKSLDPAGATEKDIRDRLGRFQAPVGYELLLEREEVQGQELYVPYFVSKRAELTGDSLSNAGVDYDQVMRPYVTLSFDARGAKRFANVTSDYAPGGAKNPTMTKRRQLAIVLDGTLYSAPEIREAIFGGNAQITGNFSLPEAQNLSIVLRAGALPAPVQVMEERSVDPTLGHDSISSGKKATLYGTASVMVFMVIYYFLAGGVANLALVLNLVLLPLGLIVTAGFFSVFATQGPGGGRLDLPTLTLPGIAGIALTIGMAVDANVLIFERMREEQRLGKSFKGIISAGYDKAFSAIFDANITTLLTGIILFWQGTGPIRGYAVTLCAGIIVSMYTALFVTRMIFDLVASRTSVQHVKMMQLIKMPNVDFLGARKICVILSIVAIAVSWTALFMRGQENFGVDFTGGAAITLEYKDKVPVDEVRAALEGAGIKSPGIQYQQKAAVDAAVGATDLLEVKVDSESSARATQILAEQFAAAEFRVIKEDNVGAQIGGELQKKAVTATVLALLGIIIYVSFRFEFPFAAGAVVALLHDVLIAVGVYCMMGRQLSVTMVAALLTIIGYSVNDTIVIFDRIRENLKIAPNRRFADVANESINQTLSRTILTSFATMLSVVALLVFGGGSIYDFALLLFIGMLSGVYSTVYIATPVVLLWHGDKKPQAAAAKA
jgi:SecD/SecF fusion protein